jgi:hypothetical protein
VGRRGRPAPAVVAVAVGQGERAVGLEAAQVEGVAVAVPDRGVGARPGLAGGDGQAHDRARVVDDVAAHQRGGVGRVGQALLDDRLGLVAEVGGGRALPASGGSEGQGVLRMACAECNSTP